MTQSSPDIDPALVQELADVAEAAFLPRIRVLEAALQQSVDDWRERGRRIEALLDELEQWVKRDDDKSARIEALEAALREIADPYGDGHVLCQEIARAALEPEK